MCMCPPNPIDKICYLSNVNVSGRDVDMGVETSRLRIVIFDRAMQMLTMQSHWALLTTQFLIFLK